MSGDEREPQAFTARLPAAEYQALKSLAFFTGKTMSELLGEAVRMLLAEQARSEQVEALVDETRARFRATLDELRGE